MIIVNPLAGAGGYSDTVLDRKDDALGAIQRAVEINERNKGQLLRDDDFAALHDDPEFLRIVR